MLKKYSGMAFIVNGAVLKVVVKSPQNIKPPTLEYLF